MILGTYGEGGCGDELTFSMILGTYGEGGCGDFHSSSSDGNSVRGQRVFPQRARHCLKPSDNEQQVSEVLFLSGFFCIFCRICMLQEKKTRSFVVVASVADPNCKKNHDS
jgi:hypothetical protein